MRDDGRMRKGHGGAMCAVDEGKLDWSEATEDEAEGRFWDDISGKEMDPEKVRKAREEEMDEYRKHGVYEKVPVAECWQETGKAPIGVRWVDVNKGDEDNPEYRSRLVAKEIKKERNDDLFAATPPLEAKKMLMSMAVTEGIGYERGQEREGV